MRSVTHHGRDSAYRAVDGEGPTTLYVHGSGGTHRVWAHQYGPDRPRRSAAALDLAGHGRSEDVRDPGESDEVATAEGAMGAYVADCVAVADAVDADVLVGNSLGGAVVLRAVIDGRLDPDGVVLVGSGAKLAVHEALRELLTTDFDGAVAWLHEADRLFHDPSPNLVERSRATIHRVGERVTRRDFLAAHRFDVREELDRVDAPLLALVGEHDGLTPPRYHESLTERVPDGEWSRVAGAAHLAMLERPAAVNERIGGFVDRLA